MGDGRLVVSARIAGDPIPAQRPRFNMKTGTTYMPKETQQAIRALAAVLRSRCPIPERSLDVSVELVFRRATHARVDVDNLAKTVLDACKGVVWKDDDQVHELRVIKLTGCGREASTTIVVRRVVQPEMSSFAASVNEED